MVSVGVSWSGKTDVFFIDPQKIKVDQNCYIDLLKTSLLPDVADFIQEMTLHSCKTLLCHTAQKK